MTDMNTTIEYFTFFRDNTFKLSVEIPIEIVSHCKEYIRVLVRLYSCFCSELNESQDETTPECVKKMSLD